MIQTMLTILNHLVKDKNVLILGFGREGKSTYRLLSKTDSYQSLTVSDSAGCDHSFPDGVKVLSGETYQDTLDDYDVVIKSPGIVLKREESSYRCKITSQTELFFEKYSNQIIGITGTKGKSTTASLLHHVLKESSIPSIIVGNIGVPAFDMAEYINSDTVIVFELSSHQLEYTKLSPHIAVLLNIYEEHLDHYGSFEKYALAKKNIYKYQTTGDILFCNKKNLPKWDEYTGEIITASDQNEETDIRIIGNDILYHNHRFTIPSTEIKLLGHHNFYNIGIVYAIANHFHIDDESIKAALLSYEPLPHRLQYVGEKNGIRYYDDSISTICETTIQALISLPDVDTVLIGGMDRGINYTSLVDFLSDYDINHVILMADTGRRIYQEFSDKYPNCIKSNKVLLVETLENAVFLAKKITAKGRICLLSPAAASYGIFKNFEERGEVFQKLSMSC